MYIPEDMQKPNRFIDVAIPSNKSYFSRLGEVTQPSTQFTGTEVAKMNLDKIAQIEDYLNWAESQETSKSEES